MDAVLDQLEANERTRRFDRGKVRVRQFKRGERLVREAFAGLGDRHRCQVSHLLIGLQKNGESVLSLAGSSDLGLVLSLASS